jgi:hypothetical protein
MPLIVAILGPNSKGRRRFRRQKSPFSVVMFLSFLVPLPRCFSRTIDLINYHFQSVVFGRKAMLGGISR